MLLQPLSLSIEKNKLTKQHTPHDTIHTQTVIFFSKSDCVLPIVQTLSSQNSMSRAIG